MLKLFSLPFFCLLLAAPTLAQTPATFGIVTAYSTGAGSQPEGIAVADVNGDSFPDLLTAHLGTNSIGVQLGTGTGSFGAVATYSAGAGNKPVGITTADVNGDGYRDALTANTGSSSVGVLLGTGTGAFGAAATYATGAGNPLSVTVADVNSDGKLDILTANNTSSTVAVLLGTGTGSFGTAVTYSTGANSSPYDVVVADVSGDGHLDLLTANAGNDTAGVLLGTGTGTFGAVASYPTGTKSNPNEIVVADVNGDGRLDLLTANYLGGATGVLLGTGTGTFGAVTTYATGPGKPRSLVVADVNRDDQLDIVTANVGSNVAAVLLNTGTGSFGTATTYSIGGLNSAPVGIAAADVNGDGRLDLLTVDFSNETTGVLLNTTATATTANFTSVATYGTGAGSAPFGLAVADVNSDGRLDLLTPNAAGSAASVQLGTGAGAFGTVTTYGSGTGSQPTGIAVADVNGDGKLDLLTANYGSNTVGVLPGTGTGTFGGATTYNTGPTSSPTSVAVADVNRDGRPDLLTANTGSSSVGVLLSTGTGTFQAMTTYSTGTASSPYSIVAADVNGDGKLDLLVANQSSSSAGVLLGTGTGAFGTVTTYSTGLNSSPFGLTVADVNGDGKLDLLTANAGSNTVSVLLGTGTGAFRSITSYSTGTGSNPYGVAVADVNRDGKPDLLTANYNNTVGVLLGTGPGTFGAVMAYATGAGSTPTSIAVADVNGDGRPDLLTANPGSNSTGVLLNSGTLLATRTALPGASASLYPNPARANPTLLATSLPTGARRLEATFYNALGEAVRQLTLPVAAGPMQAEVATTGLAGGVYLLRLAIFDAQGACLEVLPTQHLLVEP